MSQSLILGVSDQSTRASASGRCPTHITPEPMVLPAGGGPTGGWAHAPFSGCAQVGPMD